MDLSLVPAISWPASGLILQSAFVRILRFRPTQKWSSVYPSPCDSGALLDIVWLEKTWSRATKKELGTNSLHVNSINNKCILESDSFTKSMQTGTLEPTLIIVIPIICVVCVVFLTLTLIFKINEKLSCFYFHTPNPFNLSVFVDAVSEIQKFCRGLKTVHMTLDRRRNKASTPAYFSGLREDLL